MTCATCGDNLGSARALKHHIQAKHLKLRNLKCKVEECTFKFDCPDTKGRHERNFHSNAAKYFFCANCNYKSNDNSNLSTHRRESCKYLKNGEFHSSLKKICPLCKKNPEITLSGEKRLHLFEHINVCPTVTKIVDDYKKGEETSKVIYTYYY